MSGISKIWAQQFSKNEGKNASTTRPEGPAFSEALQEILKEGHKKDVKHVSGNRAELHTRQGAPASWKTLAGFEEDMLDEKLEELALLLKNLGHYSDKDNK